MTEVAVLHPHEVVRQDVEAVAEIYRNLGAPTAEQVVSRALGELALTMAGIVEKVRVQDLRDLSRQLSRLRRLPTARPFRPSGPGFCASRNGPFRRIKAWQTCRDKATGPDQQANQQRPQPKIAHKTRHTIKG
jgi:hypothetical protein